MNWEWKFVWASYGITWFTLVGYALILIRRSSNSGD